MKFKVVLLLAACSWLFANIGHALTLKDQSGSTTSLVRGNPESAYCWEVTRGATRVQDISVSLSLPAAANSALDQNFGPGGLFEDWSYSWSETSLLGTLAVDYYGAAHREEGALCYHSASLAARYIPASGETAIDWMQLFDASYSKTTTNGYLPPNTWTIDPWPNDGTDGGPFYFSNKDNPYSYYTGSGGTNSQTAGTKYFGDSPFFSRWEVNPHAEDVDFYLLLCAADTASKSVVLYDAIHWGYEGQCIPEPTTFTLLGLGSVALLTLRRRR